jgi:hypothetical protein
VPALAPDQEPERPQEQGQLQEPEQPQVLQVRELPLVSAQQQLLE